jgi:hypothetical protein
MGVLRTKQRRIALPSDAVFFSPLHDKLDAHGRSNASNDDLDNGRIPVRLWDCFDDWMAGTPIDSIADRLNVTMREVDAILRQLVTEKIANVQKKSHSRNRQRKTQKKG